MIRTILSRLNIKNSNPKFTSKFKNKKAICFGINDYPGTHNDLRGCVNDALEWKELLESQYGFNATTLFDRRVTYKNFMERSGNLIADSKADDKIAITFSGHGTHVADLDGDEPNGRDEALCLYDGLLIDDNIRLLIKQLHPLASLTIVADCCHSGTITRSFLSLLNREDKPRPRYMPPADDAEIFNVRSSDINTNLFYPEEDMKEILLTGCLPNEYSYDAFIAGKFRGAMSHTAISILKRKPDITFSELHTLIRKQLPSRRFPQSPQLEGNDKNKESTVFDFN